MQLYCFFCHDRLVVRYYSNNISQILSFVCLPNAQHSSANVELSYFLPFFWPPPVAATRPPPPPRFFLALIALRTLNDLQKAWIVSAARTHICSWRSAASRVSRAARLSSMIRKYSTSRALNRSSSSLS
jgi:hypothetical protein